MNLDQSISLLQVCLASLIRWLGSGEEVKMSATSGLTRTASSARLCPDGTWEKTYQGYSQLSLDGFSLPCSPRWSRWAMVLHGQYTGLARSARPIKESESSWWPTVLAPETEHSSANQRGESGRPTLTALVQGCWPTPRAENVDGESSTAYGPTLAQAVRNWTTPRARHFQTERIEAGLRHASQYRSMHLTTAVHSPILWPTPLAQMGQGPGRPGKEWMDLQSLVLQIPPPGWGSAERAISRNGRNDTSFAPAPVRDSSCQETGTPTPEPFVGRVADGFPRELDAHLWPAAPGQPQHMEEPPRTVSERMLYHNQHLKALGNAMVPQQIAPIFAEIVAWEKGERAS